MEIELATAVMDLPHEPLLSPALDQCVCGRRAEHALHAQKLETAASSRALLETEKGS